MRFKVSMLLRGLMLKLKGVGSTNNNLQEKGLSHGWRKCAHDVDLQLLASGGFGSPQTF